MYIGQVAGTVSWRRSSTPCLWATSSWLVLAAGLGRASPTPSMALRWTACRRAWATRGWARARQRRAPGAGSRRTRSVRCAIVGIIDGGEIRRQQAATDSPTHRLIRTRCSDPQFRLSENPAIVAKSWQLLWATAFIAATAGQWQPRGRPGVRGSRQVHDLRSWTSPPTDDLLARLDADRFLVLPPSGLSKGHHPDQMGVDRLGRVLLRVMM